MNGEANTSAIMLPEVLDFAAAGALLEALQYRAENRMPLRLDAAAVTALCLPCLQVLLAAARTHGRLPVVNPSAAFLTAFVDLGVDWTAYLDDSEPEVMAQESDGAMPAASAAEDSTDLPQFDSTEIQQLNGVSGKRILTIDDSKTMRDMLMVTLAEAGFDVLQAVDGVDGLDVLSREQVDVVITDINMPKMDGYEVVRQLRAKPEFNGTPILVLTTESEPEKRNIAKQAGATGWLVKPFDPDRLVETVRKVAP